MNCGTLYGIGIGPGDPELLTLKGARLLGACGHLFAPKSRYAGESVALDIVREQVNPAAVIHQMTFPMTADKSVLAQHWQDSAAAVAKVLKTGADACFITLGDPLLYSTYIYLLRALKEILPEAAVVTVPGITSFAAATALTTTPLGEGKKAIAIIPTADDAADLRYALSQPNAVVLMKLGGRLAAVLDILEESGRLSAAVFVAAAGMANQRIETDLRRLIGQDDKIGYLSIIVVPAL